MNQIVDMMTATASSLIATTNHAENLRAAGVVVELRETKELPSEAMSGLSAGSDAGSFWPEMTKESVWKLYLDEEVRRNAITEDRHGELYEAGLTLLEEVEIDGSKDESNNSTELELTSLTISGFGPFQGEVEYPLNDRGTVLLRGKNADLFSDR